MNNMRLNPELDNFVGQETSPSQDSSLSQTATRNELANKSSSVNAPPSTGESKVSANQPAKQGYFTSILSSLPNLSLSSIKAESSSGTQGSQGAEAVASGKQDTNPYSVSQGRHGSLPETSSFLAVNPHDPRGVNPPGSGEAGLGAQSTFASPPPQPTLPPAVPISTGGPVSYRLGNQRRLKYAPPPDLTSNTTKQYPGPPAQALFSPPNVPTPSSILNPNAAIPEQPLLNSSPAPSQTSVNLPSEQLVTPDQLSRSASLHGSFRSSPATIGAFANPTVASQSQSPFGESPFASGPPGYSVSSSKPIPPRTFDPATPQNTPANVVSPFSFYANQSDFFTRPGSTSHIDKEQVGFKDNRYTHSQDILKTGSSDSTVDVKREDLVSHEEDNTFRPISAAKVTEKLEHLLAEQKEEARSNIPSDFSSEVTNITAQIGNEAKNLDLQSILQPASGVSEDSNKIKPADESGNLDLSKSDSLSDIPLNQSSVDNPSPPPNPQDYSEAETIALDTQPPKLDPLPIQQSYQSKPWSGLPPVNISQNYPPEPANLNTGLTHEESKPSYGPPGPSLSAFFESVDDKTNYPSYLPQHTDISSNFDQISNIALRQKQDYPSFNQHPINTAPASTASVSQPFWDNDQSLQGQPPNASCNVQAPQPQFYNPAQLMGDAYKYQYPASIYVPPTEPHFDSQTRTFVTQYPKVEDTRNIVPENDFIYAPRSMPMAAVAPEPTGSATLSPVHLSASPLTGRTTPDGIPQSLQNLALGVPSGRMQYRAIYHHWFYRKEVENKIIWQPFSMQDSLRLEEVHNSSEITTETTVATDGGRYDVDILRRRRSPVYWSGPSTEVRRCSWFYKGPSESRYIPYDETIATKLEEEYKHACITNSWNRRIDLNNGEYIIFHSASVQVHYLQANSPDVSASWTNATGSEDGTYLQGGGTRPRVVKRGVDEFNIDEGEPEKVDHLLFLVHGIGSVCDLKFRTVEEVVDEFRSISLQLVQSHYRTASEQGIVNRIEVLPISWHTTLHSEDTGIDKKLRAITLDSIPKLRHFTNDTLLDILFYTSPIYCQTIMQTVGNEMSRLYTLFKERNPDFNGAIYLGGHSLGSLIVFDLLCHQKPPAKEEVEEENGVEVNSEKRLENDNVGPIQPLPAPVLKRRLSKKISYVMGAAGTGQPYINYPQLNFHPRAFFALGSPIGMFVTVRGIDTLGEDFVLPTCPAFFNIFHPFDPVAYRVESLINPEAHKYRPMLIPHHKGRKRMHLELKETMARVGADLKQKLIDSVRNTWNSVYQLALFHKPDNSALEREIDKVVEEQLQQTPSVPEQPTNDDGGADIKVGNLNGGRRIDYVLQEAPFEYINEYIFALTSHVCYWESEDTMLMILKEIYGSMGIQTDAQLPQQTLSIERPPPISSMSASTSGSIKSETTPSVS
ncbi:hypothetical protein KPH14_001465 [Odynerus spinipes]|nr:hypothetical protein KPH14_001465 [Odynerus spinipes]